MLHSDNLFIWAFVLLYLDSVVCWAAVIPTWHPDTLLLVSFIPRFQCTGPGAEVDPVAAATSSQLYGQRATAVVAELQHWFPKTKWSITLGNKKVLYYFICVKMNLSFSVMCGGFSQLSRDSSEEEAFGLRNASLSLWAAVCLSRSPIMLSSWWRVLNISLSRMVKAWKGVLAIRRSCNIHAAIPPVTLGFIYVHIHLLWQLLWILKTI